MGRAKEKEITVEELLLEVVIRVQQLLLDRETPDPRITQEIMVEGILGIIDDKNFVKQTKVLHEKYLVHNNWTKSSNIKATIYDSLLKRLTVEFKGGGVYDYEGVPKKAYKKFEKAESAGKFLSKEIIPKYKHFKRK